MKPLTTVNLKSALGNLQVSRDGSKMYAINASEGKLLRWRLPGLEEDGSVQLAGVETAVAIDPSGARIFAAGQKTISILSTEPLALKKSFQIESAIEDVVAVDKDTLLAVGSGTVLVSVSKTAVVEQYPVRGARIFMPRAEDRAYVGGGILNIKRAADGSGQVEWVTSPVFSMTAAPITQISPDGRYACSHKGDGRVLRLGRCWAAAQVEAGKVDPHSAAAFSPDSSRLYLLTADGFLKVYSVPEFNLLASHHLGVRGIQAFVPSDGKSIIVAGAGAAATPGRRQPRNNSMEVVDLYRFEIPQ
jgi:WD40 repeat protein